jgi:hypothetical protein
MPSFTLKPPLSILLKKNSLCQLNLIQSKTKQTWLVNQAAVQFAEPEQVLRTPAKHVQATVVGKKLQWDVENKFGYKQSIGYSLIS